MLYHAPILTEQRPFDAEPRENRQVYLAYTALQHHGMPYLNRNLLKSRLSAAQK